MKKSSMRKVFKKSISFALALTMCFSMLQFPIYAEEMGTEGSVVIGNTEETTEVVSEETEAVTPEETATVEEKQTGEGETAETEATEIDTADDITIEAATETEELTEDDIRLRERVNAGLPGKDLDIERVDDFADGELNLCEAYDTKYIPELSQVPHPANQGSLGTCYAFAVIGAAEANAIKKGANQSDIDYSELAMAYFTTNTVADPLGGSDGDSNSYNRDDLNFKRIDADDPSLSDVEGGNPCYTIPVLASWTGASDEALAPYDSSGAAKYKKAVVDDSVAFNDVAHIQGWYNVEIKKDPNGLKRLIKEYGGATLAYNASGNIRMPDGSIRDGYFGSDGISYYNHVDKGLNHFVTVVGWDDEYPAENFDFDEARPEDNGAWLVRNSWDESPYKGTTIEENYSEYKFFWISYYDTSIVDAFAIDVESADNYDHNYQYDLAADWNWIDDENESKAANVFTAKACEMGEYLRAVSFQTNGATNMDYTVRIYLNPDKDDPESGELIDEATTTGTTSFCGYYTVPLDNPVYLAKGDKYAVVVEMRKAGDKVGLAYELSNPNNWFVSTVGIAAGCSYYYDSSENSWYDMYNSYLETDGAVGNFKIKAFTVDANFAPTGDSLYAIEANYIGDEAELDAEDVLTASDFEITRIVEQTYTDTSLNKLIKESVDTEAEAGNISINTDDAILNGIINRKVTISYTYKGQSRECEMVLKINNDVNAGKLVVKHNSNADAYIYTGAAIRPAISVYYNGDLLKEKTDYTVTYKNNVNAYIFTEEEDEFDAKKAPTITITGKGNYKSVVTSYFVINPKDLGDEDIVGADIALKPSTKAVKPMPSVKYGRKVLARNNAGAFAPVKGNPTSLKDMTITYHAEDDTDYDNPLTDIPANATGKYIIHLEGTNNFTGQKDIAVNICDILMSSAKVTFYTDEEKTTINRTASYPYPGDAEFDIGKLLTVTVTYKEGTKNISRQLEADEYSIDVDDNVAIGTKTVTITGNPDEGVAGVKTATFKITGVNIASVAKLVSLNGPYYYNNGRAVEIAPVVVLKADSTTKLEQGVDYKVEYKNNINAGRATYVVTGIGGYSGKLTGTYNIKPVPASQLRFIKDANLVAYAIGGAKVGLIVKNGSTVLEEGKDYRIAYKDNVKVFKTLADTASFTVTLKGNYTGTYTDTFVIARSIISKHATAEATDVLKGSKVSKSVIIVTGENGKKLSAGRDYNKALKYYYTLDGADYKYKNDKGEWEVNKSAREIMATDVIPVTDENGNSIDKIYVVIHGENNFDDEIVTSFRVVDKNISTAIAKTRAQAYTGRAVEPVGAAVFERIYVKDAKTRMETELVEGIHYEIVGYANNVKRGSAKITIRGIGEYGGTKTFSFAIGQSSIITRLISLFK